MASRCQEADGRLAHRVVIVDDEDQIARGRRHGLISSDMLSSCLEVLEAMGLFNRTAARALLAAALLAALAGCFRPDDVPSGPDPDPHSWHRDHVQVEYTQPNGCVSTTVNCQDLVIFLASWMQPGGQIFLTPNATHHVWTGVVSGVPVNFPPSGRPFEVRIYDPSSRPTRPRATPANG